MARVQYKPMGMKPSVTQPKVAGLGTGTSVPSVVAPTPSVPKVNYTPGGTPMGNNTGIVPPKIPSAPTLPPPVNEPMDLRRTQVPTPNDRPPPVAPPPPSSILPGEMPMPNKTGAQRPEVPPPAPVPPVPPREPMAPKSPNVPPGDPNDPAKGRGTIPPPTDQNPPRLPDPNDPRNPNRDNPGDPANGRGTIPPDDPSQLKYRRQHETTKERIERLKAKLRERGGSDPKLEERIAKLQRRRQSGERVPGDPTRDKGKRSPVPTVQLDDDPTTWTPEMLAELAPARGTVTQFYDNAKSTDKRATDPLTGKPKKGDSDNDNVADKNEVRQSESWEQRLQRLRKKAAGGSNPQLDKRIAELEKKIKASGGQVPKDKTTKQTLTATTPTVKADTTKPTSQVPQDNKTTRGNENLNDRLTRLKEKLKSATTPEQKAQLKKRIAELEARIKVGDTKGKTNDQPGTPERPYRTRGVTYKPLGYGGSLRI